MKLKWVRGIFIGNLFNIVTHFDNVTQLRIAQLTTTILHVCTYRPTENLPLRESPWWLSFALVSVEVTPVSSLDAPCAALVVASRSPTEELRRRRVLMVSFSFSFASGLSSGMVNVTLRPWRCVCKVFAGKRENVSK